MKICVIGYELFRPLKGEAIRVFIEKDYDVYDINRLYDFHKSHLVINEFIDKSDACYLVSNGFVDHLSAYWLGCAMGKGKRVIANNNNFGDFRLGTELIEIKAPLEV